MYIERTWERDLEGIIILRPIAASNRYIKYYAENTMSKMAVWRDRVHSGLEVVNKDCQFVPQSCQPARLSDRGSIALPL